LNKRRVSAGFAIACVLGAGAGPAHTQPVAVNRDSLETMVRFLSVDPVTTMLRSRFVLREANVGLIADSLAARLGRYTGNPVDRVSFTINDHWYSGGGSFAAENIVSRLDGTGEASGTVLLTAHYDAIASRTSGFQSGWATMPAPGADDNATGVAAVMEIARSLPDHFCPFDILVVLFSGEELGKLGAGDFVGRFGSLYGDTILATINFDMLGFRAPPGAERPENTILSDYLSGWLADMIVASAAVSDPSLEFRIVKPGPSNYDHGVFWEAGLPAVTVAEALTVNNLIANPLYHTVADTLGSVDFDLVEALSNAAASYLAGFASAPAEIAVLASDVMLMRGGFVTGGRTFESGESLGVLVRVRNVGGGDVPPGATITLTVTIENGAGEKELRSGDIAVPGPLGFAADTLRVELGSEFVGGNIVRARIDVRGMANDGGNDEAEVGFGVSGRGGALLSHGFRPNPVSRSFRSASFCVNLAREADLEIELYTIEGERVGAGHAGLRWGSVLEPGLNCVACDALFPAVGSLASGAYLYRLTLIEREGKLERVTGRFAVVR
jgi:hypothetical protein